MHAPWLLFFLGLPLEASAAYAAGKWRLYTCAAEPGKLHLYTECEERCFWNECKVKETDSERLGECFNRAGEQKDSYDVDCGEKAMGQAGTVAWIYKYRHHGCQEADQIGQE